MSALDSTSIIHIRKEKSKLTKPYIDRIHQIESQVLNEMARNNTDTIIDKNIEMKKVKATRSLTLVEKLKVISDIIMASECVTQSQADTMALKIINGIRHKPVIDKDILLIKEKDIK
jgi:thiamine kinase-like enzyme